MNGQSHAHGFLKGGGELARLIAAFDWAATPLGPIERWGGPLRNTVALILRSPVPLVTLWGEAGIMIYNDAYARFAGSRHPALLGSEVREGWDEVADFNDNIIRTVIGRGETITYKTVSLVLDRFGAPEELWLDLDYSPVLDEYGTPIGVIAVVVETTEKIAAERAAMEGTKRFEAFAQAIPSQMWTATPDGLLDWYNQRVTDYSGRDAATLYGDGWATLVHPDDVDRAARAWAEALGTGGIYETEFRMRRADGMFRWHLVRATAIRDADGRITRWIGTNTDIHERKLAEAASTRDRDRLWKSSQDLMVVADCAGVIRAINPSVTRTLGWSEGELVGGRLADFVHPEDRARTEAEMKRLADGASSLALENRYLAKDGSYRLLDWTAAAYEGGIHGVARDITEERRLARDRDRVWTLSPVLKAVVREDGTVLNVNPSWTRVLGWSAAETIGRDVLDFVTDDNRAESAERMGALLAGETVPTRKGRCRTASGDTRWIEWTSVRDAGIIYSFGRDVTAEHAAAEALAAAEDALRQSQKMEAVGQLTGGIAHDFNNLLQGITGSLEIIRRRAAEGRTGELERFIEGATTAASRAAALTHRLLAFSRRQPLDPRPVRANPLLGSMEDLLRRTLGESIALDMALADGLWLTLCDPNQLENAVLNLAINARDAMPQGGRLTIETANVQFGRQQAPGARAYRAGDYVCIAVTDSGEGMSAETIKRAFEPFFTTKPIGQGTGLGLSMIYGFARQSEGYAAIDSTPGTGTTVWLYLPRHRGAAPAEDPSADSVAAPSSLAGETVLVVEDEPVVRDLVVEVLAELGYHALEAPDGPSGLAILRTGRAIDLLVTDIGLPGMNGRQVADAARMLRPDLRILFMTGYAENAAMASGFLEPGMEMITKPFGMDALATKMRQMIEAG